MQTQQFVIEMRRVERVGRGACGDIPGGTEEEAASRRAQLGVLVQTRADQISERGADPRTLGRRSDTWKKKI